MKKPFYLILASLSVLLLAGMAVSCQKAEDAVIICNYSEQAQTERLEKLLKEKFPKQNIVFQNKSSEEGIDTDADIILGMELVYSDEARGLFSEYYFSWELSAVATVINRSKLEEAGLPVPYSYQDLLNPIFSGHIAIPNPKNSTLGYLVLLSMINTLGEDEAFEFFAGLAENNIQFTENDTDPVNALIQGETAIGFGMLPAVYDAMNNSNAPLEICFVDENVSDFSTGLGIIAGRESKTALKEIFDFIIACFNADIGLDRKEQLLERLIL